MSMYVVKRPFNAEGESLVPGQVVDASSWRHRNVLVSNGYLRPITADELASVETVEVGAPSESKPARKGRRASK